MIENLALNAHPQKLEKQQMVHFYRIRGKQSQISRIAKYAEKHFLII